MAKKITSNNQSGGITAETVNVKNNSQSSREKGLWKKPWFRHVVIPLVVGLVVGIVLLAFKEIYTNARLF